MEDLLQATDDKHLILEDQFKRGDDAARLQLHSERYNFWCERYLCIHGNHDKEFWRFDIFDLLTNESKSVRFQKSTNRFQDVNTYFLNSKFMLIAERNNPFHRVNLVKLNWEFGVFETVEHFEREAFFSYILVDPLNQMKFILVTATQSNWIIEYQECELINGKIKLGNVHRLSDRYHQCLSDKLIGTAHLWRRLRIKTYNMTDKQERSFETETYPDRVELVRNFSRKWFVGRLYAAIRFQDSGSYGLMWADAETRCWNILDFSSIMRIRALHFFNDTLIVRTQEARTRLGISKSSVKVYGIDIGRPQSLRQKAWLLVIRNLKRKGHPNPYKEASKYLPLNTDLRPYWFEDVEEEAPDKQDDKQGNDAEEKAVQAKFADLSV